jgi:hypothetical protein
MTVDGMECQTSDDSPNCIALTLDDGNTFYRIMYRPTDGPAYRVAIFFDETGTGIPYYLHSLAGGTGPWSMEAAGNEGSRVSLASSGHVANVSADITQQSKFGSIRWYVKPGSTPTAAAATGDVKVTLITPNGWSSSMQSYKLEGSTVPSGGFAPPSAGQPGGDGPVILLPVETPSKIEAFALSANDQATPIPGGATTWEELFERTGVTWGQIRKTGTLFLTTEARSDGGGTIAY